MQEVKQEEEITSSVKDDVSSPVEPLSQASLVEDSQKEDVVEVPNPVEVQPQVVDILSDLACPLPASQPLIQPDVVSTLEQQLTLNGLEPVSINYFWRHRKVIQFLGQRREQRTNLYYDRQHQTRISRVGNIESFRRKPRL